MKRTYIFMAILTIVTVLVSCKDNVLFEKEMYKKVFALISSKNYNIFEETISLTGEGSIGYIAASCGGTQAPNKDIVIELVEDSAQLEFYNWSNHDADESLYAKLLPKEFYEIPDYQIIIHAGERTGKTMVKLKPEGLSPDSIYFIALKVGKYSAYELNESKSTVLYQVMIKNDYASQAEDALYSMRGFRNDLPTASNKKMSPLTKNKVRVMAGTEPFEANLEKINKSAIVLEVKADNKVVISSYKDIIVTQIDGDPDYPNTFKTEESFGRKYNMFLLHYEYSINGGRTTHEMKEELRMEVK